ncbi:MAG: DUF1549 domain-containing protein [Gemmataceae bacterium]
MGADRRGHGWIRDSLAENKPYDRFVREILTATGTSQGQGAQPPVGWYNVLGRPETLVDDMAQVFLGTRIQCAQCHHHPYEKWSQDDYWGLAAFFARVELVDPKAPATVKKKNAKSSAQGDASSVCPEGSVTGPHGKTYTKPRPLGRRGRRGRADDPAEQARRLDGAAGEPIFRPRPGQSLASALLRPGDR